MAPFSFHPAARKELREAARFYEDRSKGLGKEFLDEVKATITRICSMPAAWPRLSAQVRRCQTRRFPYGILYREGIAGVEIIAVMHLHRDPKSWTMR